MIARAFTSEQPCAVVIPDQGIDTFSSMDSIGDALRAIEVEHSQAAARREMELFIYRVAARRYTDTDASAYPWVFSSETENWALYKTNTENMVAQVVAATESLRLRIAAGGDYPPLDPALYNMVIAHEQDLSCAIGDVMPPSALSIWKAAASAIDVFVWALVRFIVHVGRVQGIKLISGMHRAKLRRQITRYTIPLVHRIAIAGAYVSTMSAPLLAYAMSEDACIDECLQTWNPHMVDAMSRVNRTMWVDGLAELRATGALA